MPSGVVAIAKSIERNRRKLEQKPPNVDIFCRRGGGIFPKRMASEKYYKKGWVCDEGCNSACIRA